MTDRSGPSSERKLARPKQDNLVQGRRTRPIESERGRKSKRRRPVAADLFCGAGGLSVGFRAAGFRIAFANDIVEDFQRTYEHNHPGTEFFPGSVEDLNTNAIFRRTDLRRGDVDVLIGGPPCQGFSINAPNRTLTDSRNYLFEHYGRLVLEGLHPKVILMENVPGMLSLDGGRFVNEIYNLFGRAGYLMKHMVLCAAHYGIPQERWRLFFIGTSQDTDITFPFPTHIAPVRANFTASRGLTWLSELTNGNRQGSLFHGGAELEGFVPVRDAIDDLPALRLQEGEEEAGYAQPPRSEYQRNLRTGSSKLFNHVAGALSKQNRERLSHIPPGGSWRDIPHHMLPAGMKRARRSDHTRRYGRIDPDGLSGTILTKCDPHWGSFFHYEQDRALTVREAARLQSFPDNFRFLGSRVSQYTQVGNAVPPLLGEVLARHIRKTLL